jgi:DNA-binding NarL/FixJ family response regulator
MITERTEKPSDRNVEPCRKRVLIVDDHPIVRQGLGQMLRQEPELDVCGEAEDVLTAIEALEATHPDLVIVDVSLKGGSGIALVKRIRTGHAKLPILVLSMHDEALYAERALRSGANGYIMKQESPEKVLAAIRRVLMGDIYLSERTASYMVHKYIGVEPRDKGSSLGQLSDRELEIFQMIGHGQTTRQIAGKLHVSIKTVESHRARIKGKMKLKNAADLMQHAIKWVQSEIS